MNNGLVLEKWFWHLPYNQIGIIRIGENRSEVESKHDLTVTFCRYEVSMLPVKTL